MTPTQKQGALLELTWRRIEVVVEPSEHRIAMGTYDGSFFSNHDTDAPDDDESEKGLHGRK